MASRFGVIDLFAGPGGLGEGFASLEVGEQAPFKTAISIEKEASAHRTLTLRSFLRSYRIAHGRLPDEFVSFHAGIDSEPDWCEVEPRAWQFATNEARCIELGTEQAFEAIKSAVNSARADFDDTILIGGPPCQAYSLVGRARSKGIVGYVPERDARHYLFREYIRVLRELRPAAFVMENVKGMLSSTVNSERVFELLMEDLSSLGTTGGHKYEIFAIRIADRQISLRRARTPSDFIVRAEDFGVPQRRHRVILVGIRADMARGVETVAAKLESVASNVRGTISDLPRVRSGLSKDEDTAKGWRKVVLTAGKKLAKSATRSGQEELSDIMRHAISELEANPPTSRAGSRLRDGYGSSTDSLTRWIERKELKAVAQHETRGHMSSDLGRYFFASAFGASNKYSPKAGDYPDHLRPAHRNWQTGIFDDRFRVQLFDEPSTTVTSHISKDGHYFIHPDPVQARSLTVREAARLQTFPDDYLFLGNRTQQYVQVGNAVPPWLARQIARLIYACMTKTDTL